MLRSSYKIRIWSVCQERFFSYFNTSAVWLTSHTCSFIAHHGCFWVCALACLSSWPDTHTKKHELCEVIDSDFTKHACPKSSDWIPFFKKMYLFKLINYIYLCLEAVLHHLLIGDWLATDSIEYLYIATHVIHESPLVTACSNSSYVFHWHLSPHRTLEIFYTWWTNVLHQRCVAYKCLLRAHDSIFALSQPYLLDIDSFKPDIAQPWSKKTWEWIGKGKPPCSDTENDLSYFTDKPAVPMSRHTWTDQQPKNCSFLFLGAIFEWLCDSQLQLNYRFIILKLNSEYLAVQPHSNWIGNKNTEIIIMSNCQL